MTIETSKTEENYLKAIFKLSEHSNKAISTNAIASEFNIAASSVTDMLQRLSEKKLVKYQRYKGVMLTPSGEKVAKNLIRKHRLWEVFLMEKLGFSWDEVHDIAEDLEHIKSDVLVERLDDFLNYPRFDPHGDPIPDKDGNIVYHEETSLDQLKQGESGIIVAVNDHSSEFLRYLEKEQLILQTRVQVVELEDYDHSIKISIGKGPAFSVSAKVSQNLLVRKLS